MSSSGGALWRVVQLDLGKIDVHPCGFAQNIGKNVERDDRDHFDNLAIGETGVARGIEFAADFSTPTASDLADWKKWRGELYASAREVEFVPLVRVLRGWLSPAQPEPQVVQSGRGPVKAWLRFSEGRVIDTLLKTVTESIDLRIGGGRVALRSLSIEAFGRLDPAGPITLYPRKFAAVDAAGGQHRRQRLGPGGVDQQRILGGDGPGVGRSGAGPRRAAGVSGRCRGA